MTKVVVSKSALLQRINRKLRKQNEVLKVAKGDRLKQDLGDFYIVDFHMNAVVGMRCDPVALAEELGVLKPFEVAAED